MNYLLVHFTNVGTHQSAKTIHNICDLVAKSYDYNGLEAINIKSRKEEILTVRQTAQFFAFSQGFSLTDIAKLFTTHHATILNSISRTLERWEVKHHHYYHKSLITVNKNLKTKVLGYKELSGLRLDDLSRLASSIPYDPRLPKRLKQKNRVAKPGFNLQKKVAIKI